MSEEHAVTIHLPESFCSQCQQKLNACEGEGAPQPGDLTICMVCAAPHQFQPDMTLTPVSPEELTRFPEEDQQGVRQAQTLVLTLANRSRHQGA